MFDQTNTTGVPPEYRPLLDPPAPPVTAEPVPSERVLELNAEPAANPKGTAMGWALTIAVAVVLTIVVKTFILQAYSIPSESMEPALLKGDYIIVSKWSYGYSRHSIPFSPPIFSGRIFGQTPTRGDIVVFDRPPNDPKTNESDPDVLIKRVIGLPGDHVKCCDAQGRITVNGQPLDEGTYLYSENGQTVAPSEFPFDVVVPKDRIWVMGDHRNNSQDSRCHLTEGTGGIAAFVPTADVVGSAVAVVYPFDRWRTLSRPATFDQVPAATAPAPDTPVIVGDPPTC